MATLNLLTYGAQTCPTVDARGNVAQVSGSSTPVDTSSYSTLRQTVRFSLDNAGLAEPLHLDVTIETGETSSGPWRVLNEYHSDRDGIVQSRRVVLSGLDAYCRVAWAVRGATALAPAGVTEYPAGTTTYPDASITPALELGSEGTAV